MDKLFITPQQAISLLNEGDEIHTFRNTGGFLLGCNYDRESLIELLEANSDKIEIAGEQATQLKHGVVLEDDKGYLFIETNEQNLNEFNQTQ